MAYRGSFNRLSGVGIMKKIKKIKLPHPHLSLPKVRKTHYRKIMLVAIVAMLSAHYLLPDHEQWLALITNLAFFYEPSIEVT